MEVTGNGYCDALAKRPYARTGIATVRKKAAKAEGMTGDLVTLKKLEASVMADAESLA
ncbi:MAG: hypothetical protein RLN82_08940 [Pseudomonadales bacterium]